jgi:hypothetical protein
MFLKLKFIEKYTTENIRYAKNINTTAVNSLSLSLSFK